ncbi:MAG: diguanylate cyclase [Pseudomonadota bacterium]
MSNRSYANVRVPLAAALGYFLVAATTIHLTSNGRDVAPVWPADAIVLAMLLSTPRRQWIAILAAGWLGNILANGTVRGWEPGISLYGAINMAQTFLAAFLLQKAASGDKLLEDTRSAIYFLLLAGLLAPLCGAAAGSLASMINYGQPFGSSFVRWFASNSLGMLIVTPFLKALLDGRFSAEISNRTGRQKLEATALFAGHVGVTIFAFSQMGLPLLFVPVLSLILITIRLGRLGTNPGVIAIALIGAISAYHSDGPIALIQQDATFKAIFFQAYLGAILCTVLPVAASIAARSEALARVAEREGTLRLIMGQSSDGILSFDRHDMCRWADGRLEKLVGFRPQDLLARPAADISRLIGGDALAGIVSQLEQPDVQHASVEFVPARRPQLHLEASFALLIQDGERVGGVLTLRDVSARNAREAATMRMAEIDDLTGVFNRKGFRAQMAYAVQDEPRAVSLALIDVDNFKLFNDNFGHATGDQVLNAVALRLNAESGDESIVGRLGGDEFAILFRCDLPTAHAKCEDIARAFRVAPVVDANDLKLMTSISCGVAQLRAGMSRGQLFDAADAALYEAKRAGRDGVRAAT